MKKIFTIVYFLCAILLSLSAQQGNTNSIQSVSTNKQNYSISIGGMCQPGLYTNSDNGNRYHIGFPYGILYRGHVFQSNPFISKGYYADKVEVQWDAETTNSNLTGFEIYRKQADLAEDSTVVYTTVSVDERNWSDENCDPNALYQYTIVARGIAGASEKYMTYVQGIGFRMPSATVTGRVAFDGGTGVPGVKISTTTGDEIPESSLRINGGTLQVVDSSGFINNDHFSIQAYVKSDVATDAVIMKRINGFQLKRTSTGFAFEMGDASAQLEVEAGDEYVHLNCIFTGDSLYLKIPTTALNEDSISIDSVFTAGVPCSALYATGDLYLGSSNFIGNIDELRVWSKALSDEEIMGNYFRCITGKEDGLEGYWPMNEGFGEAIYDRSKSGSKYNEHHGTFISGVTWSELVPNKDQLGYSAMTDDEGNYLITGIPYADGGSSYTFTPMLSPHEFEPGNKTIFLSEGSTVQNNIDFTDISAFLVTGNIKYRNTTLGVADVQLYIDGDAQYDSDLNAIVTDKNGDFKVEVPIGEHFISFHKDGHTFDNGGRFPYDSDQPEKLVRYNFVKNMVIPNSFEDTTLVTVVGRVIGGTLANSTPVGFNQSVNNIGAATIILNHGSIDDQIVYEEDDSTEIVETTFNDQLNDDGRITTSDRSYKTVKNSSNTVIHTDPNSGEFVARLIPEKFSVVDVEVTNNSSISFDNRVFDLSVIPEESMSYHYVQDTVLLDSMAYHYNMNIVYQTQPEIAVYQAGTENDFGGIDKKSILDPVTGESTEIELASYFKYPIFEMGTSYSADIHVFEKYTNADNSKVFRQAVSDAEITVVNDLAISEQTSVLSVTEDAVGVVEYSFTAGMPNLGFSEADKTSMTKTMQVSVEIEGNTYHWKPGGDFYRAYVLGGRPLGNNFFTKGPQVPSTILRDPPGSNSYATLESGSSYSVESAYSSNWTNSSGLICNMLMGTKVELGGGLAGPVIASEVVNSSSAGISFTQEVNKSGSYIETYEFTESVSTSSEPDMVGAMADVYIGKSYNYYYGESEDLVIVPTQYANAYGLTALGSEELDGDQSYTLAIADGILLNPDNGDTFFKYSQYHILNNLVPDFEKIRNTIMSGTQLSDGRLKYTPYVDTDDLRYGIAHRYYAKVVGSDTIVEGYFLGAKDSIFTGNFAEDSILTYSFIVDHTPVKDLNGNKDTYVVGVDSVKYYNDQINIWLDAIRGNEREKIDAIEGNNLQQNISFDAGVGEISRSETQTYEYSQTDQRSNSFLFSAAGQIGFKMNNTGLVMASHMDISNTVGISSSVSNTQSVTFSYVLSDSDVGDYYSIDVLDRDNQGFFDYDAMYDINQGGMTASAAAMGVVSGVGTAGMIAGAIGGATSGAAIMAAASVAVVAGGLSYIPYCTKKSEIKDQIGDIQGVDAVDISSFDISSPIFVTKGGQTMCPFEDGTYAFFHMDGEDLIPLNEATIQREVPIITVEPAIVSGIPINDQAFFDLKLLNDSYSDDDLWYDIEVISRTNPDGASIKIDGNNPNQPIYLPKGEMVTKMLTIEAVDQSVMVYDSIGIILKSPCDDIADTVYITARFQPSCIEVEIEEPADGWIVNTGDSLQMDIQLGNYNLSHASFESFRIEYKTNTGTVWIPLQYYVNDELLINKDSIVDTTYLDGSTTANFTWDMSDMYDREYQLQVVSICSDGSEYITESVDGILDSSRPQVFGKAQPSDGILSMEDDISIRFNEAIEAGLISKDNFELRAPLNNVDLKHETYLHFNGTDAFAEIPQGISFSGKNFAIEFWMRNQSDDRRVIFSQGSEESNSIVLYAEGRSRLALVINGISYDATMKYSNATSQTAWQHIGVSYKETEKTLFIYQNDQILLKELGCDLTFDQTSEIILGDTKVNSTESFNGEMHEFRIWSKFIDNGEFYANQYTPMVGSELGLYGCWSMDEGHGDYSEDKAANRHLEVSATFESYPGGFAWDCSGQNYLIDSTSYFSIHEAMDYTLEFWFKGDQANGEQTFYSNQKGDGTDEANDIKRAMSIYCDANGQLWIDSKGNKFQATSFNCMDQSWHHFALVLRRTGKAIVYIDGETTAETDQSYVGSLAGSYLTLGARKWDTDVDGVSGVDRFFNGTIDEFRMWSLARTQDQIQYQMNEKIDPSTTGLELYLPFENFIADNSGIVTQTSTLSNSVDDVNAQAAVANNATGFSSDSPNMKDIRPMEEIDFGFVVAEDEIIIIPNEAYLEQLEGNRLEILVEDIYDKYGNCLASAETWSAYIHLNELHWEDTELSYTKVLYESMEFSTTIKNNGGDDVTFSIDDLPNWLSASPSSGVLGPESVQEITFTVSSSLSIGTNSCDVMLTTGQGFQEKLPIEVRVYKTPPSWVVDPTKYSSTMNVIGKLNVNGVYSTDEFDMVAAFHKESGEIRGVANVCYIEAYDSYYLFLNIYGDDDTFELEFRIWDASIGQIIGEVSASDPLTNEAMNSYVVNTVQGTTSNPIVFESGDLYLSEIPMSSGWNWISFNKQSSKQGDLNEFFASLEPLQGDQLKNHSDGYINFDETLGWSVGTIDSINNTSMYQLKITGADTMIYSGTPLDLDSITIQIHQGWNPIGYLPDVAMNVNDALRYYTPQNADLIKGQMAFSMYDDVVGWIGTLDLMQPGAGYMLSASSDGELKYPENTIYKSESSAHNSICPVAWNQDYTQFQNNMSMVVKLEVDAGLTIELNDLMVLGVFANDEVRGYIAPITGTSLAYDPYFLTVSGNSTGDVLNFLVYDRSTSNYYQVKEQGLFSADAVLGSLNEPLILHIVEEYTDAVFNDEYLEEIESHSFSCYPSPFTNELKVEYEGFEGQITIELVSINGAKIASIYQGESDGTASQLTWSETSLGRTLPAGVYFVQISSNTEMKTEKVVKVQ